MGDDSHYCPSPVSYTHLDVYKRQVEDVLEGRSLTDALADVDGALRPAAQAVSFHAMRYLGWADAVGRELVQRYPNVLFESLLLVSLTLLKAEGEAAAALPGMPVYAPHTVVDQAVTAASSNRSLASFKGLLNACLRRFLRERAALETAVADSPEAEWNHPGWWVKPVSYTHLDVYKRQPSTRSRWMRVRPAMNSRRCLRTRPITP